MENIKRLSTRIAETSDWANRVRRFIPFLPNGAMRMGDELIASGRVYELPYIPYTGELANRLYFTENENGGATIYVCNGYIQELAIFNADFTEFVRIMENREEYETYIKNILEWFKKNK